MHAHPLAFIGHLIFIQKMIQKTQGWVCSDTKPPLWGHQIEFIAPVVPANSKCLTLGTGLLINAQQMSEGVAWI